MWELEFLSHQCGLFANHRYNIDVIAFDRNGDTMWYCPSLKKWSSETSDFKKYGYRTFCSIKSLRGFRKHLRKHQELRKCKYVELVSRLENQGVRARWIEK